MNRCDGISESYMYSRAERIAFPVLLFFVALWRFFVTGRTLARWNTSCLHVLCVYSTNSLNLVLNLMTVFLILNRKKSKYFFV